MLVIEGVEHPRELSYLVAEKLQQATFEERWLFLGSLVDNLVESGTLPLGEVSNLLYTWLEKAE